MATATKLAARLRTETGTSAAKRLRRGGKVPANMNRVGGEACSIVLDGHELEMLLSKHSGESLLVDLDMGGETPTKVLLKELQHHPVTRKPVHADFIEVSMTRKMRVTIPLVLVGEAYGVLNEGGILDQPLRSIELECLPGDLVERIEVDVSGLRLNQSLRVSDLKTDAKLTLHAPPTLTVAHVTPPRAEEETKPAEGVAAEGGAEPEVIGDAKRKAAEEAAKAEAESGGSGKGKGGK